ncbi:RICIN domain-containing protein, partial [Nonomuraea sp. NPDC000554]|uniref:RICIN domain-containing protein n=1 Tax=Nonomuraea sp. NPDC000554 TaxID=3154259 RepID=UPI003325FB6D
MTLLGLAVGAVANTAMAAVATGPDRHSDAPAGRTATGYCLDSGGDRSQVKVRAFLWGDCSNPSPNLRWVIQNGQIKNVATGYCLDSAGDNSQIKVPAYLWRDCSNPSPNLRWIVQNGQIKNVATGYCLDSAGDNSQIKVPAYLWR